MGFLFSCKRKKKIPGIMTFEGKWMELEIILRDVVQTQKDKCQCFLLYALLSFNIHIIYMGMGGHRSSNLNRN